MRNLMLTTAMALPLMMAPVLAQETATTPAPADSATDATTAPMGSDTAPAAEVPDSMNTEEAADTADQAAVAASGMVEQQQAENELRIDWITDATVNAPDGTAIGEINDVIVDAEAGTMKAAVIGVGGFLGIGEKQIAVPWDQLTINYDAQEITSELTKEQAEAAPEYVFRDQEEAPAEAGEAGSASMAPATDTTGTAAGSTDQTMTTAPMPGAPVTTTDPAAAPATTPDAAAATTDQTGATGAPTPADTAETPATPPMGSDAAAPAQGSTTAPAN